jgi:multidrug efflux pump subunit AcrB
MRIRTADGTEVPFASVARAQLGRGFASISRSGRRRVVDVTADVNRSITTPERVLAHVTLQLQTMLASYPGVSFSLEGEQRESSKAVSGLVPLGGLAIFVIYALLAIPLGSYAQPLIIMSVIPFGTVGALLGHLLMGASFTFTSVLGIVALSGVVVNSSLVLVHFVNRARDEGLEVFEAVMQAGTSRFRPIFLTSVTTFVGLVPLMFESDPGAFMVIPLAISLAFGVAFASIITLFVVPSLYVILDDALRFRQSRKSAVPEPSL